MKNVSRYLSQVLRVIYINKFIYNNHKVRNKFASVPDPRP